jgi:hypothetical protein
MLGRIKSNHASDSPRKPSFLRNRLLELRQRAPKLIDGVGDLSIEPDDAKCAFSIDLVGKPSHPLLGFKRRFAGPP